MASKRHRRLPTGIDKARKDRTQVLRKAQLEEMQAKEADMEARSVYRDQRYVLVVCPNCRFQSRHELGSQVPIAPCPNCGRSIALQATGRPQVVSR